MTIYGFMDIEEEWNSFYGKFDVMRDFVGYVREWDMICYQIWMEGCEIAQG